MADSKETIKTRIWHEEPAEDNPYAADACYCSGYDVYGDLLGKVSWVQYLYLLFKLELPSESQARLLETVAVAIANPGIRDHSVRAAMNAGVGGSTRASALIAAIAVGAGNYSGGREVFQMVRWWQKLATSRDAWSQEIARPVGEDRTDIWSEMEHVPGFDPNGDACPRPVRQTLALAATIVPDGRLAWLQEQRAWLESQAGYPLAMVGVMATALADLEFDEAQAEILYMLLRLPGAAAHALEQEKTGWSQYPLFGSSLNPMSESDYHSLLGRLRSNP